MTASKYVNLQELNAFCEQHPGLVSPRPAAIVLGRGIFINWYFAASFDTYFLDILLIENNKKAGHWIGPAAALQSFSQGKKAFVAQADDEEQYRATCIRTVPNQLKQMPTVTLRAKHRYFNQDWTKFMASVDLTLTDDEWTELVKFATCFKAEPQGVISVDRQVI